MMLINQVNLFITYVDASNLYGWATSQYLPYSWFEWLSEKEINKLLLSLIECNFIEENSSDR